MSRVAEAAYAKQEEGAEKPVSGLSLKAEESKY